MLNEGTCENDIIEESIDIDTWSTDYICLNNNFDGYSKGGCFKRVYLNKDDIKFKLAWNPNTRENEEEYYFVCPHCGLTTILDNRVLPLQIKEYAKEINAILKK